MSSATCNALPLQSVVRRLPQTEDGTFVYAWFEALHTRADIALWSVSTGEAGLTDIASAMRDAALGVEQIANRFSASSELSALNRDAFRGAVRVSDDLYNMIAAALRYRALTQGLFDVTFRSLDHHANTYRGIVLDPDRHSIQYLQRGIEVDLAGFAKGYALDRLCTIARAASLGGALINLGNSSIAALGNHPCGSGWTVNGVELHDACLTTSGNDSEARRHIVRPSSGQTVNGASTVTVTTPDGQSGEALATALFVASVDEASVIQQNFVCNIINTL